MFYYFRKKNHPEIIQIFNQILVFVYTGNHKEYNKQRHKEPQSPCDDSIYPTGSRIPLARSCSSPAASYGKSTIYVIYKNQFIC